MASTTKQIPWAQRHRVMIARVIWLLLAIYVFGIERKPVQGLLTELGIIGLIVTLLGVLVRSISAGILQKNEVLATTGIYAVVRNPLYFGSLMMMVGVNIIILHPLVAIVSLILFGLTYIPTIRNEERGLRKRYGEEWDAYTRRTPRLFPHPLRLGELAKIRWSSAQWSRNHEHNTVVAAIALLGLLQLYNHYWAI